MTKEQRIFTRMPLDQKVVWRDLSGDSGAAELRDVSRGGLSASLGRYLRPGPVMSFTFPGIEFDGHPVELDASVTWCKPTQKPDSFLAGFKIIHTGTRSLNAVSEVFYRALAEGTVGA